MPLWLHAAAHHTECFPRLAVFHHESRNNGVKRTFARRVNVRVSRIHRKKFAAILKHEAEAGHHDSAAHPAIIALNQRYHVALVISRAQVNRVPLIERWIASLTCLAARFGSINLRRSAAYFFDSKPASG